MPEYDYIDFGSGKGGCLDFARKKLGGITGLGFDLDEKKCELVRVRGFDCSCQNVLDVELKPKSVRFVTMSHFLEHLNNLREVEKAIKLAVDASRDFVYIEGPSFDYDAYLKRSGLKFFWSDWTGHKAHVTTKKLIKMFSKFGIDYSLLLGGLISNSNDDSLHPLCSPTNSFEYDSDKHEVKSITTFAKPIYKYFVFYLWLTKTINKNKFLSCHKNLYLVRDV